MEEDESKTEEIGWSILAEKSMNKIWNNKKDDEFWSKYLDNYKLYENHEA
ncbi:MAG: hypothetical protein Q7S74_00175 [Nanoarchaeota archaeon]|nr:hypothetical protein [Nanoarchaeota archaeon]